MSNHQNQECKFSCVLAYRVRIKETAETYCTAKTIMPLLHVRAGDYLRRNEIELKNTAAAAIALAVIGRILVFFFYPSNGVIQRQL